MAEDDKKVGEKAGGEAAATPREQLVFFPAARRVTHEHEDGSTGTEAILPMGPGFAITPAQADELKSRGVYDQRDDEPCEEPCARRAAEPERSGGGSWNSKGAAFRAGYDKIDWKN